MLRTLVHYRTRAVFVLYLHLFLLQEGLKLFQLLHHQRIRLEIGEVIVHPQQKNTGHLNWEEERKNRQIPCSRDTPNRSPSHLVPELRLPEPGQQLLHDLGGRPQERPVREKEVFGVGGVGVGVVLHELGHEALGGAPDDDVAAAAAGDGVGGGQQPPAEQPRCLW